MLDHISLRVQDYDRALSFYKAALAPIGYSVIMEFPGFAGLGEKGKPDFWITKTDKPCNPTHVAFHGDRKLVDAFHAAAVAAGGTDDGAPGLRTQYHPNYYGGFVLDPEGNHVEVCCHDAPGAARFASDTLSAATEKLKEAGRKLRAAVKGKGKAPAAKARGKVEAVAKSARQAAGKAAGKAKAAAKGRVAAVKKAGGAARAKVKAATKKKK
jgi:catechol 2,3-dioxygenase-like lactoylglutathione lyase family enzyme